MVMIYLNEGPELNAAGYPNAVVKFIKGLYIDKAIEDYYRGLL